MTDEITNTMNDIPKLIVNEAWSVRQLARALNELKDSIFEKKKMEIVFTDQAFVKIDTIAFLTAWCLEAQRESVEISLSGSSSRLLYLARMNFNNSLGLQEPIYHRHSEIGRFIPIRLVRADEDVVTAVNGICELVMHQIDHASDFIPAMEWAVNEIIDNIRIHSNTKVPGVVCAQYYPQMHRLDIAICDMGLGIKETLGRSHNIADSKEAIEKALCRGVTRDPEVGQGNGMAGALTISEANQGEFYVWTGDCIFESKSGSTIYSDIKSVKGTGVMFSLDTRHSVDLSKTWIGGSDWSYLDVVAENLSESGGVNVAERCLTTGNRPSAQALRKWILSVLPGMNEPLVLDFSQVTKASSSFLDELLGRLVKELGEIPFKEKIVLKGMTEKLKNMANVVIKQRLNPESIESERADKRPNPNSWLVRLGADARFDGFVLKLDHELSSFKGLRDGDAILFSEAKDGASIVNGFGRIFRKRFSRNETNFFLDGYLEAPNSIELEKFGMTINAGGFPISRLEWPTFEAALKEITNFDWASFPVFPGETKAEEAYVRELLQIAIEDDLLGPADGPEEEILGMSVRDRYLVGKLAPMMRAEEPSNLFIRQIEEDVTDTDDRLPVDSQPYANADHISIERIPPQTTDEDEEKEPDASTSQLLVPSSFGLTFCVDSAVQNIEVIADWGRYERAESETLDEKPGKSSRCWKRIPSGGKMIIPIVGSKIEPMVIDERCPEVFIQGTISSPLENGDRLVTIFLINDQRMPEQNQDEAWIFQPELLVRDPQGKPVFRRRPVLNSEGSDSERESLEMIYRKQVEFAVGHGISVHAVTAVGDSEHAIEIRTSVMPKYEVPVTETPGLITEDRLAMRRMTDEGFLDMENLADLAKDDLMRGLEILTDDYALWIDEQTSRIGVEVKGFDNAAKNAMDRCRTVLERLREGINTLRTDDHALQAFRFANKVMALQRVRSIYALEKRRGENPDLSSLNVKKNRSWRPFQLAFILLSIPALAKPEHDDRTKSLDAYADLLWFPTGGGKTEAYLGVAAFAMAIRRLQGNIGGLDGRRGLGVIMRYTLRLLTIQQFQRATTLVCAMETLRREDSALWGDEPFTIGLWVGNRVTPGTTEESHSSIQRFRDNQRYGSNSPAQLTTCPWCGAEISEGRDIEVKRDIGRTFIYCGDKLGRCDFGKTRSNGMGIPVLVVDEEIYRHPPSMLIATVDKFAMMAWRGQVRTLFGLASQECERHGLLWPDAECSGNHPARNGLPRTKVKSVLPLRPPDLIIQDEFHLISGPLGTMVGLYETAVDELSTWKIGDKAIKPKVIASTATVRKADEQVKNVFLRRVGVFPPHGLDVEDNFFSVQRPISYKPGRRYVGICSPGSSRPAVLIRVYVALLTAAQALFERFGQVADPYMTVVGYFNSLRELGGMRRLAEDDVQTRSFRVQMSEVMRPGLAQRSVKIVDELTSRVSSKDIPQKLDQLEVKFNATFEGGKFVSKWNAGDTRAIDVVLATNMLSVGVDVNRLGVMAVNGQPKNTAEYIQATSRVGRSYPGLVCTVLTWSRPRDLSHYETFEHYHSTFYKHVEAQSVTPFAPRALDRGLTGSLVSSIRLRNEDFNPNLGAMKLDNVAAPEIEKIATGMAERSWKATDRLNVKENLKIMISDRIDRWSKEAGRPGRRLGYETESRQGDVVALLKKPGRAAWEKFTAPMSMREVEPGVDLIMDSTKLPDPPPWRIRKKKDRNGGEE